MTEDFNLYPLHVFRLVARSGSASRAAQELHISQPAVSAQLRALVQALEAGPAPPDRHGHGPRPPVPPAAAGIPIVYRATREAFKRDKLCEELRIYADPPAAPLPKR